MATSESEIVNMGLSQIGNTRFIDDLATDTSSEGMVARLHYPKVRDRTLSLRPWPFATRTQILAALPNTSRTNWTYAYQYPSDCLRPIDIMVNGYRFPTSDLRSAWDTQINDAGDGLIILTDLACAELAYVRRVENVTLFPDYFTEVLGLGLGAVFALAIKKDPNLHVALRQEYMDALSVAHAEASNTRLVDRDPESEIIRVRG